MQVELELFGQLHPDIQRCQTLTLPREMSVLEVARLIGVNLEEVGLIVIDGVQSEEQDMVTPGCRLCFFPPMVGG